MKITVSTKDKRLEWHKIFAWLPHLVSNSDGTLTYQWMCFIQRKGELKEYYDGESAYETINYTYREIPKLPKETKVTTDQQYQERINDLEEALDLAINTLGINGLEDTAVMLEKVLNEGMAGKASLTPYGYCPICGAKGYLRERRPKGNDRCYKGHTYPSADSLKEHPKPVDLSEMVTRKELVEVLEVIHASMTGSLRVNLGSKMVKLKEKIHGA